MPNDDDISLYELGKVGHIFYYNFPPYSSVNDVQHQFTRIIISVPTLYYLVSLRGRFFLYYTD